MSQKVDLYDSAYGNYVSDTYRQVRIETYGEDFGQTSWVTTEESNEIPQLLDLRPNSFALEVGCGSGGYALHLAEKVGCRLVGLDINALGVRNANQLALARGLGSMARFEQCDASKNLPFDDGSFDAVFSNDVLCHLPGRPEVLGEMFRILKPGGRMLFSDALVVCGLLSNEEIATRSSIGFYEPDTFHDYQIVGIVQDTKYNSLRESPPPIVYLPLTTGEGGQTNGGSNLFFVIHAHNVAAANAAYLATLHEMAPSSPEIPPTVFSQLFRDSVAKERLLSVLSGFFALLGLLLSGIGIYGLVAWNVTQRTKEIGVRMALGATRSKVFLLVMRQVAILLTIGVFIGGLAAVFAARSISSFLFQVQPGSPWVFAFSALSLVIIGFLAAAAPARRAVSIDPMQALRTE